MEFCWKIYRIGFPWGSPKIQEKAPADFPADSRRGGSHRDAELLANGRILKNKIVFFPKLHVLPGACDLLLTQM